LLSKKQEIWEGKSNVSILAQAAKQDDQENGFRLFIREESSKVWRWLEGETRLDSTENESYSKELEKRAKTECTTKST
jgi:hypothetical protein